MNKESLLPIPTNHSAEETTSQLASKAPWFYRFDFSNGVSSESSHPLVDEIHQVRADLIFPYLDKRLAGQYEQINCIDIGCHEGWFSSQLAARGVNKVLGLDVRDEHLDRASLIGELSDLPQMSFDKCNVYDLNAEKLGTFELTFFVGVLYHLDNPVGALAAVRSVCSGMCVIETQVARESAPLSCTWGADEALRSGPGVAVVHSDPNHVEGDRSVVLVPTLEALKEILYAVGFKSIEVAQPSADMYVQFAEFDRVVLFAEV